MRVFRGGETNEKVRVPGQLLFGPAGFQIGLPRKRLEKDLASRRLAHVQAAGLPKFLLRSCQDSAGADGVSPCIYAHNVYYVNLHL